MRLESVCGVFAHRTGVYLGPWSHGRLLFRGIWPITSSFDSAAGTQISATLLFALLDQGKHILLLDSLDEGRLVHSILRLVILRLLDLLCGETSIIPKLLNIAHVHVLLRVNKLTKAALCRLVFVG